MADYSVRLSPGGVCFPEPAADGKAASATLTLANNDTRTMLFKLKTSAPDNYLVKPRFGKLAPGKQCGIIVRASESFNLATLKREQHRFQLEVRPTTAEEEEQLEQNKANSISDEKERDMIGTMMKSASPKVAKPLQFLLLTYVGDECSKSPQEAQARRSTKSAEAAAGVQTARGAPGKSLDEELLKLKDEESQLLSKKSIVIADTRTLKEAASANAEESASSNTRLQKQPPLSVPLGLAVALIAVAVALGHALFTTAKDQEGLVPSPYLEAVLEYVRSLSAPATN